MPALSEQAPAVGRGTATAVVVDVPVAVDGAVCWAKAIAAVEDGDTGHALTGEWLRRGLRYELPAGALVVTAEKDQDARRMTMTLWRSDPEHQSGLAPVHVWTRKSTHVGPSILAYIRRRLTPHVPRPSGHLVPLFTASAPSPPPKAPARHNRYASYCRRCGEWVQAGLGRLVRDHRGGVVHDDGLCVPPGMCDTCGAVSRYGVTSHARGCPLRPLERNRRASYCVRCWGPVPTGDGLLTGGPGEWRVEHLHRCPLNPLAPEGTLLWHVEEMDHGAGMVCDYPTGTIVRTSISTDSPHLPGVSVIGVVVAAITGKRQDFVGRWRDTLHTVWRPATLDEAAPVLDGEQRRLDGARQLGRLRTLVAMHGQALPADAAVPPSCDLEGMDLVSLPTVLIPAGAGVTVVAALDEPNEVLWTVIRNTDRSDWHLSNLGGCTVVRHTLTPERRDLFAAIGG